MTEGVREKLKCVIKYALSNSLKFCPKDKIKISVIGYYQCGYISLNNIIFCVMNLTLKISKNYDLNF